MKALTSNLSLRTTADWENTSNPQPIPVVWGRTTLTPIRYSLDRRQWVVSDGTIGGIDQVRIDDVIESAWQYRTMQDATGRLISLLVLNEPLQDGAVLSVDLRGQLDSVTGNTADSPADVVYWLLQQNSSNWTRNDLNPLRAECLADSLKIGGLFADRRTTLRTGLDSIVTSIGGVWSVAMPGIVRLYPKSGATAIDWEGSQDDRIVLECAHSNLRTAIRVSYDFDYAKSEYKGSVTLIANDAIKRWGRIETDLEAPWLRDAPAASLVGQRALSRLASPLWRLKWTAAGRITLGTVYTMHHDYIPGTLIATVVGVDYNPLVDESTVTAEALSNFSPRISVERISSRFPLFIPDRITYELLGTTLTLTIPNATGAPLAGALVTLDGQTTQATDSMGRVQFANVLAGTHDVHVEADGYEDKDYQVTL